VTLMKLGHFRTALILGMVLGPTAAHAQPAPSMNYTSFQLVADQPVQLGHYGSGHKDCSAAPLPAIRVVEPPKLGQLTVRRARIVTNEVARCPNLMTGALVVSYRAHIGSAGADHLVYELTAFNGEVGIYDVMIDVKPSAGSLRYH
jgi:hypothetical protein